MMADDMGLVKHNVNDCIFVCHYSYSSNNGNEKEMLVMMMMMMMMAKKREAIVAQLLHTVAAGNWRHL